MTDSTAEIHPLPGIKWSARAALHDALNRCPEDAYVLVLWTDKDVTEFSHASHSQNSITAYLLHIALKKLLDDNG